MLSTTDLEIYLEKVQKFDDQNAFHKIFVHFYQKLKSFAFSIVGNIQIAEDIVSEVFLILWNNRKKMNEIRSLNSYLYTITKNLSFKEINNNNRVIRIPVTDELFSNTNSAHEESPEDILLTKELAAHIEYAIELLPPKCKLIYRLVKIGELKYKEVAALLDISIKTVDTQMVIATKKITHAIHSQLQLSEQY